MRALLQTFWGRLGAWVLGLVVLNSALVPLVRAFVPVQKLAPDFICFYAAAELIADGQNPYDPVLETQAQRTLGWDKATDGIGLYDCLPYFYPPWFAMLFVPLLPLGYLGAKAVWLLLSAELLVLSGFLLRDLLPAVPRKVPVLVTCAFALSVFAVLMGQTPPLLLFLMVATWWLLQHGRDGLAGAVLVWLAIKPQLSAVLLVGLFLWAVRQGRWQLFAGFALSLGALGCLSWMRVPGWPLEMLQATGRTPLPTDYFPWYGTTWLLALKSVGLRSAGLWVLYLALALPMLAAVVRLALNRSGSLADLFALSSLATFYVAPYGQPYDFVVLLIPFLVLISGRLNQNSAAILLWVVLVIPYLHIHNASLIRLWWLPAKPAHQVTLFWFPIVLTSVWFASFARLRLRRSSGQLVVEPAAA